MTVTPLRTGRAKRRAEDKVAARWAYAEGNARYERERQREAEARALLREALRVEARERELAAMPSRQYELMLPLPGGRR